MTNWPLALIHQALAAIEFVAFCDLLGCMVQGHGIAICDGPHSFTQTHRRPAGLLSASSGLAVPPAATLSTWVSIMAVETSEWPSRSCTAQMRVALVKTCVGFKSWAVWLPRGSFFVGARGGWLRDLGRCPGMI